MPSEKRDRRKDGKTRNQYTSSSDRTVRIISVHIDLAEGSTIQLRPVQTLQNMADSQNQLQSPQSQSRQLPGGRQQIQITNESADIPPGR